MARPTAIQRLHLLDRAGDPALTALTRITAYVAGGGAAAVHVFDDVAQHRVAATDAPLGDHPREDAMCKLVVDGERRIVCTDATQDPRFSYSSFVTGDAPVRFYASTPLRAMDGEVIGTLCAWDTSARELSEEQAGRLEDLAEQVSARMELVRLANDLGHQAIHDPLTGVLNRVMLDDRLALAFARQLRAGGVVLVAVVDLDEFKLLNDTLGHDAGDEALKAVARRLKACVRAEDTVARLGGDEFAVVAELPTGATGCREITARLNGIWDKPCQLAGQDWPLKGSVGVAVAEAGDDVRTALERADQAMYVEKRSRRSVD